MFKIGDKVVYPMHGAGVIDDIEQREILGKENDYYVLKFPVGDMKVMVPINAVDKIGLRDVIDEKEIKKIVGVLAGDMQEMPINWNKRYRQNMDKIKSGDIFLVADVVRDLSQRDKEKSLSTAERKLLSNARQIIISELMLSKSVDEDYAASIVDRAVNG